MSRVSTQLQQVNQGLQIVSAHTICKPKLFLEVHMGLVNNENYINIQGWMINELDLSGNTLLVYAIIYGYSQDGKSTFRGSLQYLADWCNATKQGIQKNLKELLDRGLIQKFEYIENNQKFCEYSCIPCNKVVYPMQQSCTNNIEHTIGNRNISNNKLLDITVPEKPKKKNLYNKCSEYIMQYTNNVALQEVLHKFLDLRLEIAKQEGKPFYYNMWPSIVIELDKYDTDTAIEVVKQSIQKGWKRFYEIKDYSKNVKTNPSEKNIVSSKETEEDIKAREAFVEDCKAKGLRYVF